MQPRIPEEWRVPIVFVVIMVVPSLVAVIHPALWGLRTEGHAAEVWLTIWLVIWLIAAQALLQRSHAAWWILVVIYLLSVARSIQRLVSHGLGTTSMVLGVLTVVNFALLVSAPMRRFVRLRGRLAPRSS